MYYSDYDEFVEYAGRMTNLLKKHDEELNVMKESINILIEEQEKLQNDVYELDLENDNFKRCIARLEYKISKLELYISIRLPEIIVEKDWVKEMIPTEEDEYKPIQEENKNVKNEEK